MKCPKCGKTATIPNKMLLQLEAIEKELENYKKEAIEKAKRILRSKNAQKTNKSFLPETAA